MSIKFSPEQRYMIFANHIGHVVTYYWDGHTNNHHKILRVEYVEEYDSFRIWVDIGEKFPRAIYDSNLRKCECFPNIEVGQ